MKRILILICLSLFCLCGCQNKGEELNTTKQIIVFPSEQTAKTLNGYKEATDGDLNCCTIEYIGNNGSKRFHLSDCRYAKNIKQENIEKSFDRNRMINSGYAPCQTCNP